MSSIFAVANQKGGVGKTTTVASLGVALASMGRRVLLVDLDPQACLTFSLGLDPDDTEPTIQDVLTGRAEIRKTLVALDEGVDLIPANIDLAGAESYLITRTGREYALSSVLSPLASEYDVVLVDCPPSLGVLTLNALTAADEVIIPVQCETLSHRGVSQLMDTIADVCRLTNRRLKVRGLLPTLFDGRTNHAKEVLADIGTRYRLNVLDPPVRRSIRFAEAPKEGRSIYAYAPSVPGAQAYLDIAQGLVK